MKFPVIVLLFIVSSFAQVKPFKQEGRAYVYSDRLVGHRTTSGERYDPALLTAAHATLPLQSVVQVTNLKNGKKVLVKINDRMARHRYTIIDLSRAAAAEIGMLNLGSGQVRVEKSAKFTTKAYQAAIAADPAVTDSL